ncbi:MAG TPA: chromate efflux transporter [Geminicoccus sp.]|uniref:chromate efflux transporter n=1 Tax=Geminicoccus sp. TaxID=2024832 RepID=UPI002E358373|nr:chromate efflux transporter [Geminicoccus sp.]HEX2529077.1 chromate efflux transporter [Geminicoccus sp.]
MTMKPGFREAVWIWAKIGLLGFGGPAGQIALMHRILVDEKKWLGEAQFINALNYCMLLPGPEAQQLAVYVGWLLHGTRGGIVAGTLFVLPGLLVILALSTAYALFQATSWLAGLFFGLKAAILAVVLEALLRVAKRALKGPGMVALAVLSFLAIFAFGVPFPLIVLAAGLAGLLGSRLLAPVQADPAVAVDERPAAELGWARPLRIVLACGSLWVAPILLLTAIFGQSSVYPAIGWFFSKMAVVTFGGAYAALAWVAQEAVETQRWLAPGEMLDGLALAETTPGPLILVLTYVGFLAGLREAGGIPPLAGGLLGGLLTSWVTFVPSFLWIFIGAPYVERLRGHAALSGALSAITAAVVGVIANLAVWFALHSLFGRVSEVSIGPVLVSVPDWRTLDPLALALAALAMVAMFGLRIGMIPTLAICGAAGLGSRYLFGMV